MSKTPEEIEDLVMVLNTVSRLAMLVPLEDARELLNQYSQEQAIMPMLDPTRYIRERDQTEWHSDYLNAFLTYRSALEKIKEKHLPKVTPK